MDFAQFSLQRTKVLAVLLPSAFTILGSLLSGSTMTEIPSFSSQGIALGKMGNTLVVKGRARASTASAPIAKLETFEERCHKEGVLVCVGFDTPKEFVPAKWPNSGLYPAWDNAYRGSLDTGVRASGKGSLRFEVPSHSAANAAGSWVQRMGHSFGEESTFYVEFRQRFSAEMLKNKWGETSWKQVIFHNSASSCSDVELTTGQYYQEGLPIMYTDCGGRGIFTNNGTPPYKLEQGDYDCWYSHINRKDCFFYPSNQWTTFYYQVSIGHWGKPDSTVNAWVALDGQPFRQWIQLPNFILKNDTPGRDYDTVTLLTYMTNKNATVDHPVAYTWYDELIVSTAPIAPPTAASSNP
jgi:hypothetical protein